MKTEEDILKKIREKKGGLTKDSPVESIKESKENKESKDDKNNKDNKVTHTKDSGDFKREHEEKGKASVLFLFDATGSMQSLWDSTKQIIKEMVERITKVGNIRLKCVAYRDYCDGDKLFESSEWYSESEPLFRFLSRIKCDGGGDEPEAVEAALKLAYEEIEDVTRVVLIADAYPHPENWETCKQYATLLGENGRPVFAFSVGNNSKTQSTFSEIAKLSGGSYSNLRNYQDLLDMICVTIVHDVDGDKAVKKYIEEYGTSKNVEEYSKSLPSIKRS